MRAEPASGLNRYLPASRTARLAIRAVAALVCFAIAVVLARDAAITPEDLLLEAGSGSPARAAGGGTLQAALDDAAAARIRSALAAAGGERTAAARALGVDRTTLYRLMRRLGL